MDAAISSALFAATCLVVALAVLRADRRVTAVTAAATALYLGLDDFVTGLPHLIPALDFLGGRWNWSGKVLSLALSVAVIVALRLSPDALGFRFRQEHPRLAWMSLAGFVAWGAMLGAIFQPGMADPETLAFQATMPGLAEEIVYRGIAPAVLLGLINSRPHVSDVPWAVIIGTSLMFGVWHALSFSQGSIDFEVMSGLFPMIGSIAGGWLRFKTRSLLIPVLGHALANVAFHVAGGPGG
ncbi:CPBP family intramembrane glutamic endopeptidase [Coralloluteibacterium thermophilus]|uniref:CPBP family intramembrane glutamic endopeptidase n=1 Tax=Coralloluteibacterium thermophilum TaxID=2707049 RepID=A0ABV9NLD2_9GAMM